MTCVACSWEIHEKFLLKFIAVLPHGCNTVVLKRPFLSLFEGLATLERLCSHDNANINRAACAVIQKHFSSSTAILTAWADDDIKTRTRQHRIWDYSSIILVSYSSMAALFCLWAIVWPYECLGFFVFTKLSLKAITKSYPLV